MRNIIGWNIFQRTASIASAKLHTRGHLRNASTLHFPSHASLYSVFSLIFFFFSPFVLFFTAKLCVPDGISKIQPDALVRILLTPAGKGFLGKN